MLVMVLCWIVVSLRVLEIPPPLLAAVLPGMVLFLMVVVLPVRSVPEKIRRRWRLRNRWRSRSSGSTLACY